VEKTTVGRFTYDPETGTVSGPAEYMREQGNARIAQIERGGSVADQMIIGRAPNVVVGILVVLQTDYAGWHGSKVFFQGVAR
jgi:hypothetical protein